MRIGWYDLPISGVDIGSTKELSHFNLLLGDAFFELLQDLFAVASWDRWRRVEISGGGKYLTKRMHGPMAYLY